MSVRVVIQDLHGSYSYPVMISITVVSVVAWVLVATDLRRGKGRNPASTDTKQDESCQPETNSRSDRLPNFGGQSLHVVWTDGNKDSALLLYGRTGGGTFGHQALADTVLVSTVWMKRDGKWLAVHHHESDVVKQQ
jgi:hypothetical protein